MPISSPTNPKSQTPVFSAQNSPSQGWDSWGHATRAADLTSGMLHGGQEPVDIYRRIMNGINGTPMPGFKSSLESEPETIWNLVSYVLSVSNRRREGTAIPAGLVKPYAEPVEVVAE